MKGLATWPLALRYLRVCWPDWTQEYNCGRCEKCVRTMISLYLAGVLERSATFPQRLDPKAIRHVQLIRGVSSVKFLVEMLAELRERPADREIARAVAHVIRRDRLRTRLHRALAEWPALRAAFRGVRRLLVPSVIWDVIRAEV